jgi:selenocysteine lyase/cysteine desulfurase
VSWKHLFRRSIDAAPHRLHMAAHSHHLWPDASHAGQLQAWEDAARLADRKWERVMGEIWPAAAAEIAGELGLPDPATICFAPNTHEHLVRIASAREPGRPLRILASDGEFHSFRRQAARWAESGAIALATVPVAPAADFAARFRARAAAGDVDLIMISQVMFTSGLVTDLAASLAGLARPDGPWLILDGYHGFMAVETDLGPVADRLFYLGGGYKYAMAGEGVAFVHAPPGFALRPLNTGWYAEFDDLSLPPGAVGFAPDGRRLLGSTFDPSGLYRFLAVRRMLAAEGLTTAAISAHVAALKAQLVHALGGTALGTAELLNPPGAGPQARFLALRSPHAARWRAELLARDVITDVRGDVLRIGLGLYHDEADIAAFAKQILTLS